METNRTKSLQPPHLGLALTLALLVSVALPTHAQNPPRQVEPVEVQNQPEQGTPGRPVDTDHDGYGITRQELAAMDGFLDNHPETAEQLRKDPSLIDNKQFLDHHPELQAFLQSHPGIREEFDAHPDAFMHAEQRYEWREDGQRGDNRGITRQELATMDRFLDSHPEIAEQLRKNPALIDNKQFVDNHPELQSFLQSHPELRQEFREHPYAFMRDENRFDDDHDRDSDRREVSSFGNFLRGHASTADALAKDPSLANSREFLASHPDLNNYLQAHPAMQQQLASNPQAVMTSPALVDNSLRTQHKPMTTSPTMGKPDTTMNPDPKQ